MATFNITPVPTPGPNVPIVIVTTEELEDRLGREPMVDEDKAEVDVHVVAEKPEAWALTKKVVTSPCN